MIQKDMVNYENTKIYKIYSHAGDKIYIGSTTKNLLSQRMALHRSNYKTWKTKGTGGFVRSYELFEQYGIENCIIELLEAKPCINKDESLRLEGDYIKKMNCVNKIIAGRTKKQWDEDHKEQKKQYYVDNKEQIREQHKQYREDNKDKNRERDSKIETCSCGSVFIHACKTRHLRTLKHKKYLENLTNIQ